MQSKILAYQNNSHGHNLAWLAFLLSLGIAVIETILPNFAKKILGNEVLVGYFYATLSLVMLAGNLLLCFILERISKIRFFYFSSILLALSSLAFIFIVSPFSFISIQYLRTIIFAFVFLSLGLMVRDFTPKEQLGRAEGARFVFSNIGWFIGPILAGVLAKTYGNNSVFLFSAGIFFLLILFFLHQHFFEEKQFLSSQCDFQSHHFLHNFSDFFQSHKRKLSYLVGFGLGMWWVVVYVYFPLFIINRGLDETAVGIFLAGVTIPLLLFEKFAGRIADQYGINHPLIFGFSLLGVAGISAFFINDQTYLVLLFFILASIGAAFIEPLQEMYFFQATDEKEENRLFGIFYTSNSLAKFIMPLLASSIILFFKFEYIFFVIGILMLMIAFLLHIFRPMELEKIINGEL